MDDFIQHRRRSSDRAHERIERASAQGDHAAYVMATSQLEEALRRRAEWLATDSAGDVGQTVES